MLCRHSLRLVGAANLRFTAQPRSLVPAVRQLTTTTFAAQQRQQSTRQDNYGIVQFEPFDEVKGELQHVENSGMGAPQPEESFARVGYAQELEFAVNEQINIEYNMSYVYHSMSSYFNRDNVALPGLANYFRDSSLEERGHAQMLMDFQAVRGGRVKLAHITAPESNYAGNGKSDALHAMELALSLEKLNFQKLKDLHSVADKAGDAQATDFVEAMLEEQVKGVKSVADYVAQLRRVGDGHGVWHWDQVLQENPSRLMTPSLNSIPDGPGN